MSFFGLLGGQKGQINERIMKVGNYVDYEWGFLVVKHEAKKKLLVTTLSKAAAVRSHGSQWGESLSVGAFLTRLT